jgi:hypothetical protein
MFQGGFQYTTHLLGVIHCHSQSLPKVLGWLNSANNMIHDYSKLKVGDKVTFSFVRDRLRPNRVEYLKGVVIHESIRGWRVRISVVTDAIYTVNQKNYIGHKDANRHHSRGSD